MASNRKGGNPRRGRCILNQHRHGHRTRGSALSITGGSEPLSRKGTMPRPTGPVLRCRNSACRGVLGVLHGYHVVGELNEGEYVDPPNGALECKNPRCRTIWEVRPVEQEAA